MTISRVAQIWHRIEARLRPLYGRKPSRRLNHRPGFQFSSLREKVSICLTPPLADAKDLRFAAGSRRRRSSQAIVLFKK